MNFDEQMDQGGPMFWAITAVVAALAYAALWVVMALPTFLGAV